MYLVSFPVQHRAVHAVFIRGFRFREVLSRTVWTPYIRLECISNDSHFRPPFIVTIHPKTLPPRPWRCLSRPGIVSVFQPALLYVESLRSLVCGMLVVVASVDQLDHVLQRLKYRCAHDLLLCLRASIGISYLTYNGVSRFADRNRHGRSGCGARS